MIVPTPRAAGSTNLTGVRWSPPQHRNDHHQRSVKPGEFLGKCLWCFAYGSIELRLIKRRAANVTLAARNPLRREVALATSDSFTSAAAPHREGSGLAWADPVVDRRAAASQ